MVCCSYSTVDREFHYFWPSSLLFFIHFSRVQVLYCRPNEWDSSWSFNWRHQSSFEYSSYKYFFCTSTRYLVVTRTVHIVKWWKFESKLKNSDEKDDRSLLLEPVMYYYFELARTLKDVTSLSNQVYSKIRFSIFCHRLYGSLLLLYRFWCFILQLLTHCS